MACEARRPGRLSLLRPAPPAFALPTLITLVASLAVPPVLAAPHARNHDGLAEEAPAAVIERHGGGSA